MCEVIQYGSKDIIGTMETEIHLHQGLERPNLSRAYLSYLISRILVLPKLFFKKQTQTKQTQINPNICHRM